MRWIELNRFKIKVFGKAGKFLMKGIQEEHTAFLHNLLSNDIKGMISGSLTYNLRLKQNGAPLQDFYVYRIGDYYILDSEGDPHATLEEFSRLKLSMKVYFEILPYRHLFVFGRSAKDWIKEVFGVELQPKEVATVDRFIVAHNPIRLREEGYDVMGQELSEVLERLRPEDRVDEGFMERLRIQRCIPKVGKELREGFSPLEANVLDYAISLNKGCYVGQEAIARVFYRGRTPRTLALFEGQVREGVKIRDEEKDVGLITSCVDSLALGYILRDRAQEGKEYTWGGGKVKLVRLC